MGSAVIKKERAMHPAFLYALSEYSILYENSYKVYKESVSILFLKNEQRKTRKPSLNLPIQR
jgi:hypothetical protein